MEETPLMAIAIKAGSIVAMIFAIIIHEMAHGFAALKCGDPTAKERGRLSLNPVKHIDPLGSIVLPALLILTHSSVLIGWAKPVPINLYRTRDPRRALWITAIAGPISNLLQAAVGCAVLVFFIRIHPFFTAFGTQQVYDWGFYVPFQIILSYIFTNISLFAFNILPFPPLDGSRLIEVLLPGNIARMLFQLERFGIIIIYLIIKLPWFDRYMNAVFGLVIKLINTLAQ